MENETKVWIGEAQYALFVGERVVFYKHDTEEHHNISGYLRERKEKDRTNPALFIQGPDLMVLGEGSTVEFNATLEKIKEYYAVEDGE